MAVQDFFDVFIGNLFSIILQPSLTTTKGLLNFGYFVIFTIFLILDSSDNLRLFLMRPSKVRWILERYFGFKVPIERHY